MHSLLSVALDYPDKPGNDNEEEMLKTQTHIIPRASPRI